MRRINAKYVPVIRLSLKNTEILLLLWIELVFSMQKEKFIVKNGEYSE